MGENNLRYAHSFEGSGWWNVAGIGVWRPILWEIEAGSLSYGESLEANPMGIEAGSLSYYVFSFFAHLLLMRE